MRSQTNLANFRLVRVSLNAFDFTNFSDGAQNFGPLSVPGGKKRDG